MDDSIVTFQVAKDGYWHFLLVEMRDARIAKEIVFDMGRTV